MNFNELIQDFYLLADESKQLLQNMLGIISSGKSPEEDLVAQMDNSIDNLREKYKTIQEYAKDNLQPDEMPESGCSVNDYKVALDNSKSRLLQEMLRDIRKRLVSFIAIRSFMKSFSEALEPFQNDAKFKYLKSVLLKEMLSYECEQ